MRQLHSLIFLFMAALLFPAACGGHSPSLPDAGERPERDSAKADTPVLKVALLPTADCLPFYYADSSGIFDSLGLRVKFLTYTAQPDCDTAWLGKSADGGFTDLVRVALYRGKLGRKLTVVMGTDGRWALVASGTLRMKKLTALKERMVAVTRQSVSDYYSSVALSSVRLDYPSVFRPQINDLFLRASMLTNNQVDAAMLPEPQAYMAVRQGGHKVLWRNDGNGARMGCLAFRDEVLRDEKKRKAVSLLLQGYARAAAVLNRDGAGACRQILADVCGLGETSPDSLQLPRYGVPSLPEAGSVRAALTFLRQQAPAGWKAGVAGDDFTDGTYLPKK